MHFCIPLIEYPTIYDIRSKPKIIRSPTGTRDLQMVDITLRILYKPQEDAIAVIHQYDQHMHTNGRWGWIWKRHMGREIAGR